MQTTGHGRVLWGRQDVDLLSPRVMDRRRAKLLSSSQRCRGLSSSPPGLAVLGGSCPGAPTPANPALGILFSPGF